MTEPNTYAIGLGSNRRQGRHGTPASVLRAALVALGAHGIFIRAVSPIIHTTPLGPSLRRYANAAALVETALSPPALLAELKRIERDFGRRRGRRWGARVIDLDILLWSGGRWQSKALTVPHEGIAERMFVLQPLVAIAPGWRLPDGKRVRHLRARLAKRL